MKIRIPRNAVPFIVIGSLALLDIFGPQIKNLIHSDEYGPGEKPLKRPANGKHEPGTAISPAEPAPIKPTQVIMSRREVSAIDLKSATTYSDAFPHSPVVGESVWFEVLGTKEPEEDTLILRDIALDQIIIAKYGDSLKKLRAGTTPGARFYPGRGGLIRVDYSEGSGYLTSIERVSIRHSAHVAQFYPDDERFAEILSKIESGEYPLAKSKERTTKIPPEEILDETYDSRTGQFVPLHEKW